MGLTALIIIGIGKFADFLFHVEKPKHTAYKIEGLEVAASVGTKDQTEKDSTSTDEVEEVVNSDDS